MKRPTRISRQFGWIKAGLLTLGGIVLLCIVFVIAAAVWLGSASGLSFILEKAERSIVSSGGSFQAIGARGGLYRGITFDRVAWSDGKTQVSANGVATRWSLRSVLRREIVIPEITIADVTVRLPPAETESGPRTTPIEIPADISLPVSFELTRFNLQRIAIHLPADPAVSQPPATQSDDKRPGDAVSDNEPIEITSIHFGLSYQDGAYSLHDLQAKLPWGEITDTRLSLNDKAPNAVVMRADFRGSVQAHPVAIKLAALGNLNGLNTAIKGEFDQSPVSVDIRLRPLEPNPIVSVTGWIRQLDLGRLEPPLPKTALNVDFDLLNPRALPRIEEVKDSNSSPATPARAGSSDAATGRAAWRGTLAVSNAKSGPLVDKLLPLRNLSADLQLDATTDSTPTKLTLSSLKLEIPGATEQGTIAGMVEVLLNEQHSIAGSILPVIIAGLQFRNIDAAQFVAGVSPTAMNGILDLTRDLFTLDLSQSQGPLRQAVTLPGGGRAQVKASGRLSGESINLDSALVQLNSSRLTASGRASLKAPFELAMGGSLENVNPDNWIPRSTNLPARFRQGRINADWSVNGQVSPRLDAKISLKLSRSKLLGHPFDGWVIGQIASPDEGESIILHNTDIRMRLGQNVISAKGNLGRVADKLQLSGLFSSPGLIDPRLSGSLSFKGELGGKINNLNAQLKLSGDRMQWAEDKKTVYRLANLSVEANMPLAAAVTADTAVNVSVNAREITMPGRQLDDVALKVNGLASQHDISLAATYDGQSVGMLARGGVNLEAPMVWQGQIAELNTRGKVSGRLSSPAGLLVTGERAELSKVDFVVLDGRAELKRLALHWAAGTGEELFNLSGRMSQLPVGAMATIAGAKELPPQMQGLRLGGEFSLAGRDVDDVTGRLQLALTEQKSAGSKTPGFGLTGENQADVRIDRGQLRGELDLSLPSLAFSRQFTGSDWVVDGQIRMRGKVAGTLRKPLWDARLTGSALSLFQPALGWRFSGGTLDASFADDVITLQELNLKTGDGTVTLAGQARLLDASTKLPAGVLPLDGRFTLTSDRAAVPLGPGQRIVLSGESSLSSSRSGLDWSGNLNADEGLIEIAGSGAPSLPSDVVVTDVQDSAEAAKVAKPQPKPPGESAGESPKIKTQLKIDLGKKLRIAGGGVNARLTGQLLLHGELPDSPRVSGEVKIEDGSYFAYNQELKIERGAVRFTGAMDNPLLDIVAIRPDLPVKAGVALGGTALSPRVQLTSTPPLSDAETLSWIVLGTPLESAQAGAQSLALKQAAAAFLGNEDGSLSSGGLVDKIGVDVGFGYASDTSQTQGVTDAGSPTGLPGSTAASSVQANEKVFTLGKKLSKRLSVSYEKGLEGVWNLLRIQYEISNRLSLRAQTGSESALDLIYYFSFD
ncbi:MAG: translocation/assembly module TamB domain-containing protein [Burkholderiaceae bacterium]